MPIGTSRRFRKMFTEAIKWAMPGTRNAEAGSGDAK
jgi:hypothetical protein